MPLTTGARIIKADQEMQKLYSKISGSLFMEHRVVIMIVVTATAFFCFFF